MTELIIQTGKHQGKTIDLAGTDCIIGRHEGCKIRIASEDVSKQHCRLKHKPDGLYLKDLGSRNGTFLNDQQITEEVKIKPGDLLRIGPMTFLVAQGKAAPAKAQAGSSAAKAAGRSSTDDDMIAAWLSEGGDLEKSGHDTTEVIPPQPKPAAQPAASDGKEAAADTALKSVRERSQEIIRRWHKKTEGKG
jgi:pSer/pThr/pTyr-binding forkhead associated (FHA) protein